MAASFFRTLHLPVEQSNAQVGENRLLQVSAQTEAALMPSSSFSSTAGQTTKH